MELSIQQATQYLSKLCNRQRKYTKQYIYKLIKTGKIVCTRLVPYMIDTQELDKYAKNNENRRRKDNRTIRYYD